MFDHFETFTFDDWCDLIKTLPPVEEVDKTRSVYYLDEQHVLKLGYIDNINKHELSEAMHDYLLCGNRQNIREAQTWARYRGTGIERYLCPVIAADIEYGIWLVMKRVVPCTQADLVPTEISNLEELGFMDVDGRNIGLDHGRVVLLDYGIVQVEEN